MSHVVPVVIPRDRARRLRRHVPPHRPNGPAPPGVGQRQEGPLVMRPTEKMPDTFERPGIPPDQVVGRLDEAGIERTWKVTLRPAGRLAAGQELQGTDHTDCPNSKRAQGDVTIR